MYMFWQIVDPEGSITTSGHHWGDDLDQAIDSLLNDLDMHALTVMDDIVPSDDDSLLIVTGHDQQYEFIIL